ncbi:MAG: N-acetylmuramic acid 6-phosphate etherase [Burkholderiaceae bacterium]
MQQQPSRTESVHPHHSELDLYPVEQLVGALVDDQLEAVSAVRAAAPDLVRAVEAALPRMLAGGRLIYVGAGTSGRLGLLDSVELLPTFSWPPERAVALLAGGPSALMQAVEGAEDDEAQGAADLAAQQADANDVVLAIAASGRTPYVLGALRQARVAGALTIGFANNPGSRVAGEAQIGVTLDTGPEIISGSTRLKAGTAQKIALNTFSSALMVRLHKVYGNLMVDMKATNAKLVQRAINLTMQASGADAEAARRMLESCDYRIKIAVVALKLGIGAEAAAARLERAGGAIRTALAA